MDERDKRVLQAVIDSYIATGFPIGSAVLVKNFDFGLSSATIRNIMAELEEMGYLTHPHTSAGRVPTDKGYRYYIDGLIQFDREAENISDELRQQVPAFHAESLQTLMEEASQFLATLSRYTGVIVAPSEPEGMYRHIEFIRLRGKQVLIIFVTNTGNVQNKLIEMDESISQQELNTFGNYIDQELERWTLSEVRQRLLEQLQEEKRVFARLLDATYYASQEVQEREGEKVYIVGTDRMIETSEFSNLNQMKALFKAFEEKYKLLRLLDKSVTAEGIRVFIGSENPFFEMQGCSLVASKYRAGTAIGTLGVIGPVRMQYRQVIRVVDYTSKLLSRILLERYEKGIEHDK